MPLAVIGQFFRKCDRNSMTLRGASTYQLIKIAEVKTVMVIADAAANQLGGLI